MAAQPRMDRYILALDQSTNVTGWALYKNGSLNDYGKIQPDGEYLDRIVVLRNWLIEKVNELKGNRLTVAIEEIQLQRIPGSSEDQNVVTFKKLAHVQGVILELLTEMIVPYEVVPSSSWKSACGVKGKARTEQKQNAQKYVLEEFGIKAIQDICDAICIGKYLVLQESKKIEWD